MLVLSRKPGQAIWIGEDISITVLRISPNTVRIGIEAPHALSVVRSELVVETGHDHVDGLLDDRVSFAVPDGVSLPRTDRQRHGEHECEDLGGSVLARQLRGDEP